MPIAPQAIQAQLERVLSSSRFLVSKRLSAFLRYAVEETLAGRAEQIKQYTVAVRALEYDVDFDPQINPVIRIQAGRLRRALQRYYETEGANDPLLISIPKGAYVPTFAERSVRTVAAQAAPAAVPVAETVSAHHTSKLSTEPFIAVLPFLDLSSDREHAYLASGLTEEIVLALTQYSELTVMGPLSRQRLAEEGLDARGIGTRYGARFVLDGSVRWSSGQIRIGIKLTDTMTGAHLWAKSYDCQFEPDALFDIQQEIARHVLGMVAGPLGLVYRTMGTEMRGELATRPTVQEAMFRFYHFVTTITREDYDRAVQALENALEVAPDTGPAWAALAGLQVDAYALYGEDAEHLILAQEYVHKAMRLAPGHPLVLRVRAYVFLYTRSADELLEAVEQAVRANPHTSINGELGLFCVFAGHEGRGLALIARARELNPHLPYTYRFGPFLYYAHRGEYERALSEIQDLHVPGSISVPSARAAMLGYLGRQPEARGDLDALYALVPDFATQGQVILRRRYSYRRHVDMLWEGLRKAGLKDR